LPYGPGSVLVGTTRPPGGRGGGRFDRCPPRSWTVSAVEEQSCGRLPRVTGRLTSRCACAPRVWNGTDSGAEPRIHLVEAAALIRTRVPAGRRRYSSWPMMVPGAIAWSLPSTADVNQRTVAPCARIWSARSAASRAASSTRRLAASIAGITAATSDPRNRLRRVHPFGPAGLVADEPDHGCRRFSGSLHRTLVRLGAPDCPGPPACGTDDDHHRGGRPLTAVRVQSVARRIQAEPRGCWRRPSGGHARWGPRRMSPGLLSDVTGPSRRHPTVEASQAVLGHFVDARGVRPGRWVRCESTAGCGRVS